MATTKPNLTTAVLNLNASVKQNTEALNSFMTKQTQAVEQITASVTAVQHTVQSQGTAIAQLQANPQAYRFYIRIQLNEEEAQAIAERRQQLDTDNSHYTDSNITIKDGRFYAILRPGLPADAQGWYLVDDAYSGGLHPFSGGIIEYPIDNAVERSQTLTVDLLLFTATPLVREASCRPKTVWSPVRLEVDFSEQQGNKTGIAAVYTVLGDGSRQACGPDQAFNLDFGGLDYSVSGTVNELNRAIAQNGGRLHGRFRLNLENTNASAEYDLGE